MSTPKKYWADMNEEERLEAYENEMENFRFEAEAHEQLRQKVDQLVKAHDTYMERMKQLAEDKTLDEQAKQEAVTDADSELIDAVDELVDWYTAEPPDPNDR